MSVCIHGMLRRQCETCDLADRLESVEVERKWLRERVAWLENALAQRLGEIERLKAELADTKQELDISDGTRDKMRPALLKAQEIVKLAQAAKAADVAHRKFIREALAREPLDQDLAQDDDEAGALWVARQRAFDALFAALSSTDEVPLEGK